MKRVALALAALSLCSAAAFAQQTAAPRPGDPDPYAPKVGAPDTYSPRAGDANPYATKAGAPDTYAPRAGDVNPYATRGGDPVKPLTQQAPIPAGSHSRR